MPAKLIMQCLIATILLVVSVISHPENADLIETQKIDHLIAAIETLDGAQFVHNGKAHAARDVSICG